MITIRHALDSRGTELLSPKHGKTRKVPISDRLGDELSSLPKLGIWVVSQSNGDVIPYTTFLKGMRDLYKKAGVNKPPKPVHCLRHTFGTESAARGMPLPVLKELMGHADIKTTMKYVHVNEAQMREEMRRVFSRGSTVAASEPKRKTPELTS